MSKLENCHVDELVFMYQDGDEMAGLEILDRYGFHYDGRDFTKYAGKYFKLLRRGTFNFKDKDSRAFIRCFTSDKELSEKLVPFYQYKETISATYELINKIVWQLKPISDEEIKQELSFLFLKQVKKFKKISINIDFSGYLYNSYGFKVKNWIKKIRTPKEPYMHMYDEVMSFAEDVYVGDEGDYEVNEYLYAASPIIEVDEEIGNSWVRGLSCGDEFKDLTPLQRLIIKLHDYDGMTDGKIAESLGIHINTIFRQRKKVAKIVKQTMKEIVDKENDYGS
jgi:DNA-directed RNA polymerase specialized sigma24 family protein